MSNAVEVRYGGMDDGTNGMVCGVHGRNHLSNACSKTKQKAMAFAKEIYITNITFDMRLNSILRT